MLRSALALFASVGLVACNEPSPGGGGTGTDSGGTEAGPGTGTGTSGETEESAETGPANCEIPSYADDLVVQAGASEFPGTAHRMVTAGAGAFVCGDGFFAEVEGAGSNVTVVSDPVFAGNCTGVSPAGDGYAVVSMASGMVSLVALGGTVVATVDVGSPAFDVVGTGTDAWVAAGAGGIVHYPIAAEAFGASDVVPGAQDARGLAMVGGALLVADGYELGDIDDPTVGGAAVRLVDTAGGGALESVLTGPGVATRPFVVDGRAVVLRPGWGFDVFDVTANSLSLAYSTFAAESLVDAAFDGNTMLAAGGSRLVRFDVGAGEARLVSGETRPSAGEVLAPWYRTVVQVDGTYLAALGDALRPVDVGAGEAAPEITFDAQTLTMGVDQTEALFSFMNLGDAPLIVTGVEVDAPFTVEVATDLNPERPGCPGEVEVAPEGTLLFYARIEGVSELTTRTVRVLSNDPDEPELEVNIEINRPPPAVGDTAEDFHLLTVDGTDVDFSAYLGKVVLAKLYNPL